MMGSVVLSVVMLAYSSGPPDGYTGAPGESTCAVCHSGGTVAGTLYVEVLSPTWGPGDTMQLAIRFFDTDAQRWGFELTILDTLGQSTGTLIVDDPATTQLSSAGGRTYLKHTAAGTFAGQTDSVRWTFRWVVPDLPVADLYIAANAANNDGSFNGDAIYTYRLRFEITEVQEGFRQGVPLLRWESVPRGVVLHSPVPQEVTVFRADGRVVGRFPIQGTRRIPLAPGLYWIRTQGDPPLKVVVLR